MLDSFCSFYSYELLSNIFIDRLVVYLHGDLINGVAHNIVIGHVPLVFNDFPFGAVDPVLEDAFFPV
jgi:hypothetical protein